MAEQAAQGKDVETDHEYDGIREFDNPLPRWWLLTFYGTVVFGVGYWFYFHTLSAGLLPRAAMEEEMAQAAAAEDARQAKAEAEGKGVSDEQLLTLSKDPEVLRRGEAVFKQNCLVCHGDRGQGVVGPNLTDSFWLHGSRLVDNYKVVSAGVLDKGMPAWKPVLGLSKVRDVVAYVATMRDKNVPGKPPQGTQATGAGEAPKTLGDAGKPAAADPAQGATAANKPAPL